MTWSTRATTVRVSFLWMAVAGALVLSLATLAAEDLLWCYATGYRVKGKQFADVTWTGAIGSQVLLFRGQFGYSVTDNDGSELIALPKGDYFQFAVCEYPVQDNIMKCSNVATAMFPK